MPLPRRSPSKHTERGAEWPNLCWNGACCRKRRSPRFFDLTYLRSLAVSRPESEAGHRLPDGQITSPPDSRDGGGDDYGNGNQNAAGSSSGCNLVEFVRRQFLDLRFFIPQRNNRHGTLHPVPTGKRSSLPLIVM